MLCGKLIPKTVDITYKTRDGKNKSSKNVAEAP